MIDVEPTPESVLTLIVVEDGEEVETLFRILLTSASAASFYACAAGNFVLASDKNLFSVSSFKLAACNSF